MNDPTARRPTGAAVTAALTAFMGFPVAFAIFVAAVTSRHDEGGLFEKLARAWQEGGWAMYAVLLVSGLAAVGCAAFAFFGVQRGSIAILACAPVSALITAVGAIGFFSGMRNALEAVAHVHPADKATILAAGTSEALTASAFGMAGTAGLVGSLALGCLFGVVAQTGVARRLLAFSGGAFLALALVSLTAVLRLGVVMGIFRALAFVSPADRLTILVGGSDELAAYRVPMLGALALLALVVIAGAVALKEQPRAAVLLPLLGFGGLVGLGTQAIVRASLDRTVAEMAALRVDTRPLIELAGFYRFDGATRCLGAKTVGDCLEGDDLTPEALKDELEAVLRREAADAELFGREQRAPDVPVAVRADASAASLWRFIDTLVAAGGEGLELMGQQASKGYQVVGELAAMEQVFRSDWRGVPLGVGPEARRCKPTCTFATAQGEALVVDGQTWTAGPVKGETVRGDEVYLRADRALTPQTLAKLALAAASHDRKLVLVLPNE
jgi:hypothetical protein